MLNSPNAHAQQVIDSSGPSTLSSSNQWCCFVLFQNASYSSTGDSQMQSRGNSETAGPLLLIERCCTGTLCVGLNLTLLELDCASQINGCAFALIHNFKDARLNGETEQRIEYLNAWRETPFFLQIRGTGTLWRWQKCHPDCVTSSVSDEIYDEVSRYFYSRWIANLLMVIVNSWNRIAITTRTVPYLASRSHCRAEKLLLETLVAFKQFGSKVLF